MKSEGELRRLAGQVVIAGYEGRSAPREVIEALGGDALGGVILFTRNLISRDATDEREDLAKLADDAAQVAAIVRASKRPPIVAVDQEGGRVQRLRAPILELPPMRVLGEIDDVELTRDAFEALGRQLRALGFNLDFAPVLDVDTNPDNPVIGDRSFGADPARVARHGAACAEGLRRAGVLSCAKHFPGHGDTVLDSHLDLPSLPHELERLEAIELRPFRELADQVPTVMTAHIVFRALDPERPATLSPRVIDGLLRGSLGYGGLIVSDDLEMRAIADHFSIGAAAVQAVRAGCDALLVCRTWSRVREAVDALAEEASRDAGFGARLEAAAGRVAELRAGLPPLDESADALAAAVQGATDVAERLERAVAALGKP